MKVLRILIPAVLTLAIVTMIILRVRQNPASSLTTPFECVDAFYNAVGDGNQDAARRCLIPELHDTITQHITEKRNVLSWGQYGRDIIEENTAYVVWDETRPGQVNVRRYRFRLEAKPDGWRIVAIGSPISVKQNVPSNTPVGDVPNP